MKLLFLVLLMSPWLASALEIDEKLTIRIVRTSESKKTVMINRGTEDGLVEGDHAKLIVTAGIVARAVCIRVSPSRSVWAVYRLVNADFIVDDSVMTLKISPPVKITKDDSQALVQDDVPARISGDAPLGIPLADGAQDMSGEAESVRGESTGSITATQLPTSIAEKNVELLGQIHISGLSAFAAPESGGMNFSNSHSYYHIGLGGEFYPRREREWYSGFSIVTFVNLMRENAQAYNGAGITNASTEFSLGLNWHPFTLPSAVMRFIPFFHLSANLASHRSDLTQGTNNPNANPVAANGMSNGFALGVGYKLYTYNGFGVRALLDYYRRVENYKAGEVELVPIYRLISGPRFLLALSYRF